MTEIRDDEPIDAGYRDPDIDGCPHCRDPKTCEECAEEKIRSEHIDYLVKMLDESVGDAVRAVAFATDRLRELTGSAVYDIELAEGSGGGDALDDLAAAARLLRNVERIVRERMQMLKAGY